MKNKWIVSAIVILGLMLLNPAGLLAFDMGDVSIHGFVSQGYLKSSDNNYLAASADGTFEFNETAINFSAEPAENLRIGLQLMSRDMGRSKNNDIYLDWGYADYRFTDAFGIRVGKVKVPMGLYNQSRDIDFLRTCVLLPQGVYNENVREFLAAYQGGSIYGNFNMGFLGNLEYELMLGTMNVDTNAPLLQAFYNDIGMFGTAPGTDLYADMEYGFAPAIRWNTPIDGLRFGFTTLVSDMDWGGSFGAVDVNAAVTLNNVPVVSVEYILNNLKLAAEYQQFDGGYSVTVTGAGELFNLKTVTESYYAMVSYQLYDWLELGTYYSVYYADKDDRDGNNQPAGKEFHAWQKDWTVSAKFNVLGNMTLKLESHFIDGVTNVYEFENPEALEQDWVLYTAKCSINF